MNEEIPVIRERHRRRGPIIFGTIILIFAAIGVISLIVGATLLIAGVL